MIPTLTTPRLLLRPLELADAAQAQVLFPRWEIVRYMKAVTTFVGTPSAGTDGDVSDLVQPGGIRVWFTGSEVRHFDGRQLRGIGILPDVRVAPTIQGLRAGRDEVLETALHVIATDGVGSTRTAQDR